MGDWIAFWDSQHSIYVNARHRDVHYRTVARDIRALLPSGASVLDFGCGDALHADLVAEPARRLILCEAAPKVRAALIERYRDHPKIEVRAPDEVTALPAGSLDAIVTHSVAQYLGPQQLDALLADFRRLLADTGILILGDVLAPHVSALRDVMALLRFAAAHGFLGAALVGLARTLASEYPSLRSILEKLAAAGFSASRAPANIGHNPARMTFLARPR
jgi:SAM-dependent methyltransferase